MPWQNCRYKVYLVIILFCMPWQNCGNKVIILFCMPWQNCGNKVYLVCVCVCVCARARAHACVCVCVFLSLQHFDMIKDKTYGLFKTYFYNYNTFPADNLLIVRSLKVLPCYLKVASG